MIVPGYRRATEDFESPVDLADAGFFLSTIELHVGDESGMPRCPTTRTSGRTTPLAFAGWEP